MTARAALVLSVVALVAALGGTAVGAHLITGRDIENRSIGQRDLRTGAVTGRVARNLSGRDIRPNSIDGSDVAEETLDVRRARAAGQADVATRADGAGQADALAGGIRIHRIHFAGAPGADGTVLDVEGLRLQAACSQASLVTLAATTAAGSAWVRAAGSRGGNTPAAVYAEDDDFRPGDVFDALAGAHDNSSVRLTYVGASGAVVSADLVAEQGVTGRPYGCLVAGTATSAPAG